MSENEKILLNKIDKMKIDNDIEIANLKINYIGSLIVVVCFLFLERTDGINIGSFHISVIWGTIFTAIITTLFLLKESVLYAKYISKKIIFKVK